MRRGRQEALLRHLRTRGEREGGSEYQANAAPGERAGDRLKQELVNLAGKRLVRHKLSPALCLHENPICTPVAP